MRETDNGAFGSDTREMKMRIREWPGHLVWVTTEESVFLNRHDLGLWMGQVINSIRKKAK